MKTTKRTALSMVERMRLIRDRMNKDIKDMDYAELKAYLATRGSVLGKQRVKAVRRTTRQASSARK